jgi:hypothetical protein
MILFISYPKQRIATNKDLKDSPYSIVTVKRLEGTNYYVEPRLVNNGIVTLKEIKEAYRVFKIEDSIITVSKFVNGLFKVSSLYSNK